MPVINVVFTIACKQVHEIKSRWQYNNQVMVQTKNLGFICQTAMLKFAHGILCRHLQELVQDKLAYQIY